MNFFVTNTAPKRLSLEKCPAIVLLTDKWDDYGTKSQFYMYFFDSDAKRNEIGSIKVLHEDDLTTKLPKKFEKLDEAYISLGQDPDFYENLLKNCGTRKSKEVLLALNDISWQPPLAEPFESKSSFRNSLLRNNSAQRARRFGQAIILGEDIDESFNFYYKTTIPGAEDVTECHFNLEKLSFPLSSNRLVGIIGRNATGKTQFLSALAKDLVQIEQMSRERTERREQKFSPQKPLFNRIITISYSAFDQFARPRSKQASYVYCGIRNEKGGLSKKHLTNVYLDNLKRIKSLNREHDWLMYMLEILGERGEEFEIHLEAELYNDQEHDKSLSLLSSGQAILANFITSLIAWLDDSSLVLFDEPETHLHPNAVASLFNVFNKILDGYDSYAILATHSPLVIQEIPRKNVIVFEREGQYTTAKNLPIETFGENVSELTRHVFETVEIPSHYRVALKSMSEFMSFEEVMGYFDGKLSMNAQSFLLSQYMEKDDEGA